MRTTQQKNSKSATCAFKNVATQPAQRPAPFSLRLTSEERTLLERLAAGLPLGFYIKSRLFGGGHARPTRGPMRRVNDERALAQALTLLGQSRIASNLNQLAKAAHMGTLPVGDRVERDLEEACAHIAAIKGCLVDALGLKDGR